MSNSGLYNGNISWMTTDLAKIGEVNSDRTKGMQAMLYKYDQLHRIKKDLSLATYDPATGFATRTASPAAYDETYSYDANGNIQTLKRNSQTGAVADDFNYTYDAVDINKLLKVKATDTNYAYDKIGNLITDNVKTVNITWTPYGKVRSVSKFDGSQVTNFNYDAAGNRITKKVIASSTTTVTNYLRDASGNVMAVYSNTVLTEQHIYGSARLGQYKGGVLEARQTLGKRTYELSNHLGNVLTVISDNIGMDATNKWAKVINASDYYAFGLEMNARTFSDASAYRYGFNGKEKDGNGEFGDNDYDYGFRIYNPRISRFLSVDPLTREYPWNSTYAFAENDVVRSIDLEGTEKYVKTYSYRVSDGKTVVKVTDDVWEQKTDMSIHPTGTPQTFKQIAAHSAITYQRNPKPGSGSFAYFEFAPELGKTNYAKYSYTANGKQQVQYFSQADMQFRFDEIMTAEQKLSSTFNIAASAANLIAAGWLVKAELKGLSGELKGSASNLSGSRQLLEWDELRNRAIMSDSDLKIATSTDGSTFRAVVQNIENAYGNNVWDLMKKINQQANAAGASNLEVRGIEIVNPDLMRIFRNSNGKTLMGYNVNYIENVKGYPQVTLTKTIK
jgi:RHS repeat-associated protein